MKGGKIGLNGHDARFVIKVNVNRNFIKRNLLPIDDTGCETVQRKTIFKERVKMAGSPINQKDEINQTDQPKGG